jgi:hypothetical protein
VTGRSRRGWVSVEAWRRPRVFAAEEPFRRGYPGTPDADAIYAVFDGEPGDFYKGWVWDYAKLAGKKTSFASAEPFALKLVEVPEVHR